MPGISYSKEAIPFIGAVLCVHNKGTFATRMFSYELVRVSVCLHNVILLCSMYYYCAYALFFICLFWSDIARETCGVLSLLVGHLSHLPVILLYSLHVSDVYLNNNDNLKSQGCNIRILYDRFYIFCL